MPIQLSVRRLISVNYKSAENLYFWALSEIIAENALIYALSRAPPRLNHLF